MLSIIITHLHLTLNNGMSTTSSPKVDLEMTYQHANRCISWAVQDHVKQTSSDNDHTAAETDASDHCSTSP